MWDDAELKYDISELTPEQMELAKINIDLFLKMQYLDDIGAFGNFYNYLEEK